MAIKRSMRLAKISFSAHDNKEVFDLRRKRFVLLTAALALMILLTACASTKLDSAFDQQKLTQQAKQVAELLVSGDYDTVVSSFREDLQSQLTAEQFETALDAQLKAAGALSEYKSATVIGQTDKTTEEAYAVVVLVGKYESATLTFTISFNKNYDLIGLYMK